MKIYQPSEKFNYLNIKDRDRFPVWWTPAGGYRHCI